MWLLRLPHDSIHTLADKQNTNIGRMPRYIVHWQAYSWLFRIKAAKFLIKKCFERELVSQQYVICSTHFEMHPEVLKHAHAINAERKPVLAMLKLLIIIMHKMIFLKKINCQVGASLYLWCCQNKYVPTLVPCTIVANNFRFRPYSFLIHFLAW